MKKLKEYATETEANYLDAVEKHGSNNKAAKALGVDRRTVDQSIARLKKRAGKEGYAPGQDFNRPVVPGFTTKRVSTAKRVTFDDGTEGLQWHIQEPEKVALEEIQAALAEAFRAELKGLYKHIKKPKETSKDLMSCYLIGDHHFGMYAWGEETGSDDYDTDISEKLLVDATTRLIDNAPSSEIGTLVNVGDFLHANDTTSQTPTSKAVLDTDGRMGRVARKAGLLLKSLIDQMLTKHKKVLVINARGNHDPDASLWLNEVIRAYYHKEKRVEVKDNFSKFIWFEYGKNLVVVHHGDKIKRQRIYEAITRNLRDEWGRAEHVFGWTGHIHHKEAEEIGGMLFESWNVLPPPDAWHASAGYGSERSMTCVVLHKEHGEQVRYKVKV